jgi:hypothetical protein
VVTTVVATMAVGEIMLVVLPEVGVDKIRWEWLSQLQLHHMAQPIVTSWFKTQKLRHSITLLWPCNEQFIFFIWMFSRVLSNCKSVLAHFISCFIRLQSFIIDYN